MARVGVYFRIVTHHNGTQPWGRQPRRVQRCMLAGRKGASPHVVCGTTDGPGQGLLCLEHGSSVHTVPHEVRLGTTER